MKKLVFIILFGIITIFAFGQNTKLDITLSDALRKTFTEYNPKYISGLKWYNIKEKILKNSNDKSSVLVSGIDILQWDTLFKLSNINKNLEMPFKAIPSYTFTGDSIINFMQNATHYQYNFVTDKLSIKGKESTYGENGDYNEECGLTAYTLKNNLYIFKANGDSIIVTDFKNPQIVSGQSIARNEYGIEKGTFWSPKGSFLAFYQKDESNVSFYPEVDITTTPASLNNIKYPMAGMGSEVPKVGIFDVKTNKTIYLNTSEGEPDHYLTNLSWDPSEKFVYLAVINRATTHVWFNKYDITTGAKVMTLFEETNERYTEPVDAAWFIPGRPNEFLWFSMRNGFKHLYHYDTNGKLLNQVSDGKITIHDILGKDQSGKKLFLTGTDESGLNDMLYIANIDKLLLSQVSLENGIHNFQLNSKGNYLIDMYSNLNTPRITRIIDKNGVVVNELLKSPDPLTNYKAGETTLMDITSADGKTMLHGRMIKPFDFDPAKKYKVLVYVYGGPHFQMVKNSWLGNSAMWMYSMANRGYIVFSMDNRGSENRGFEFESVIHRNLGANEIEDQMKGVEYLKSLPYVDTTRMAVHGWSFGGFMTTSLMLRKPGVFKVGVAGGPVINWEWYEVMYGERYMDTPQENPEGYKNNNLLNYAQNLKGDLLLIHGSVDPVVVPQHSMALLKKFVELNKKVDFFTYPMHEHNVIGPDRLHLMTKILDYIDEKIDE